MGSSSHATDAAGRSLPDPAWPPGRPAPDRLELVRRWCNTANHESGAERFGQPWELDAWLAAEGFAGPPVSAADVERVVAAREAVRCLALGNTVPSTLTAAVVAAAAEAFAGVPLRVAAEAGVLAVGPDPAARGVDACLAALAAAMITAAAAGSWSRLKACSNEGCRWVFYDQSRNSSGRWCSMQACGCRLKARAYRRRRAADGR
jgi:predicted RNA-binding Zn ribbon-like protein